ncbi:MAG: phytanoyl-CoA dioxygenase family protein [Chloroflexota bacterium]
MTTRMRTETDHALTNQQRDALMAQIERDGYAILPYKLPADVIDQALAAIDRISAEIRADNPGQRSVKMQNCVDTDPAFRRLMMYTPALQMAYDVFGPMFHLNQSNFVSRPRDEDRPDFVASSPWHCDGPRPGLFPDVNGTMGLHYLKFGYFLTDLTHGTGGSLQVVRGSHSRAELDGKTDGSFDIQDYADDLVQFDCEAGTIVAFHQAQWHAAPPNLSDVERKNVYISYCPTWMRPVDRDFPSEADLVGLTDEERWLLGEPRPALRWWLPSPEDRERMGRFARPTS